MNKINPDQTTQWKEQIHAMSLQPNAAGMVRKKNMEGP